MEKSVKNLAVDFNSVVDKMKPLHGINNGPHTLNHEIIADNLFKQAGIPFCRLHDTDGSYGNGHVIDVPNIFRDFDADPEDPANYYFNSTDGYLKAIKKVGADIIYRLGVSIENWAATPGGIPINIHPPKDAVKWARICAGIIRHYNEGWADGFYMDIKRWEIWNEPESRAMWTGTLEEFNQFYTDASKYLKAEFPHLKFGGYATIGFYPVTRADKPCFCDEPYITLLDKIEAFLKKVRDEGAPLGFLLLAFVFG